MSSNYGSVLSDNLVFGFVVLSGVVIAGQVIDRILSSLEDGKSKNKNTKSCQDKQLF
jgi:glucokinase